MRNADVDVAAGEGSLGEHRRTDDPAILRIAQLEVVYNHVQLAVQGLSLQVGSDEIVAVLGTNGAGKTTTLRAISGFLPGDNAAITRARSSRPAHAASTWPTARAHHAAAGAAAGTDSCAAPVRVPC